MRFFHKKSVQALLCAAVLTAAMPLNAMAIDYDPAITGEMGTAEFWSGRMTEPQTPLATSDELSALNQASRDTADTGLRDLSGWTETEYNGVKWAQRLRENAMDTADHIYNDCDARFDAQGREYLRWTDAVEEFFAPMIENCLDRDATKGEHELYAICTTATHLRSLPSEEAILTRSGEDLQLRAEVLLGEPLILKGESDDGKFVYAYSGSDSGWMDWQDLAVCYDRDGWLRAWQFSEENTLSVYGDGVRTQALDPEQASSDQSLHMGTRLQLADVEDYQEQFSFDSARGEYVVWLPLRSEGGWYDAQLAVVDRNDDVTQGYLTLNSANLAAVALKKPKEVYRWSQDDSLSDSAGYLRSVYRCFGLELSGSASGVSRQPLRTYSLKGMSDAEKTELLKQLPLGTLLKVSGKELFYLGSIEDRLYVISAADVSASGTDELHSTVVDTMDTLLPDGSTLLNNLKVATVPFYRAQTMSIKGAEVTGLKKAAYTGEEITQSPEVRVDGVLLREGVHYTLSYSNNVKIGKATVIIRGKGNWTGKIKKRFAIQPADTQLTQLEGDEGSLSARWEKRKKVKGYQLQYSTREDFSKAVTVTVKGRKKKSKTIDNLKSGETYYVRVRTYTKVKGKKYTSSWSEAMSVEVA